MGAITTLGFSVYLNESLKKQEKVIESYRARGFNMVFTSLHIPEEDSSTYRERLYALGKITGGLKMGLMMDIASDSFSCLGLSLHEAEQLSDLGVTGLRLDEGFDEQTTADLSGKISIALNASTLTPESLNQMKGYGMNVDRVSAWHNFYPRPETGLDRTAFRSMNKMLQQEGLSIAAFFPGDKVFRGPLYQGLPTLEDHRYVSPFFAYTDLLLREKIDDIVLGDPELTEDSLQQFSSWKKRVFLLRANPETDDRNLLQAASAVQSNRTDEARDCIRSRESRQLPLTSPPVVPFNTHQRRTGSITIDNELYKRYQGEIQIVKKDLPADPKVNVIGHVIEADLPLLSLIHGGDSFQIKWVNES